MVSKAPDSVP